MTTSDIISFCAISDWSVRIGKNGNTDCKYKAPKFFLKMFFSFRTATVWRDLEPFWGEEYTMFLPVGFTNLSVYVYDEDTIG